MPKCHSLENPKAKIEDAAGRHVPSSLSIMAARCSGVMPVSSCDAKNSNGADNGSIFFKEMTQRRACAPLRSRGSLARIAATAPGYSAFRGGSARSSAYGRCAPPDSPLCNRKSNIKPQRSVRPTITAACYVCCTYCRTCPTGSAPHLRALQRRRSACTCVQPESKVPEC